MSAPIQLTVSGAGYACAAVPPALRVGQITGILAAAGTTDALNVTLYASPTYSTSAIPSGSLPLAQFVAAVSTIAPPFCMSPDGIEVGGYIIAHFTDADPAHVVYVYVK